MFTYIAYTVVHNTSCNRGNVDTFIFKNTFWGEYMEKDGSSKDAANKASGWIRWQNNSN